MHDFIQLMTTPPGSYALVWLVIALVLGTIEVMVTSFVFLLIGMSALLASVFAALNVRVELQVIVFALSMVFTLGLLRPRLLKKFQSSHPGIPGRAEALVGKTGQATEDFNHGQGRVTVAGEDWMARCKVNVKSGTPICVKDFDGITLIVDPL